MAGNFDDEAEQTVSIDEYLATMEAEELETDLVLGGDEGDECTYAKGSMKRQAIFSCLTCTPDGNAGVCTACCLSCHDGHEVMELWTKRNFRCDCGNSKFGVFSCKLLASKDVENTANSYNHNFKGLYCTCNRPYPDPDVEDQTEMIQCCVCEDWFHEEHLDLSSSDEIPRDEEGEPVYEDFICKSCSPAYSFLTLYPETIWAAVEKHVANADTTVPPPCEPGKVENDAHPSSPRKDKGIVSASFESGSAAGKSSEITNAAVTNCVIGILKTVDSPEFQSKALFLSKNWRDILCRCEKCIIMYNQKSISYLLDKDDSIAEYEKRAKLKRAEKLQQQEGDAVDQFNNLNHVTKMEILSGIQDFTTEFRGFLESNDPSKAITADDVHQLFENLKNKRRRTD